MPKDYYEERKKVYEFLGGVCVVCGTTENLQIHHKDPLQKQFAISEMLSLKWETIVAELKKCELRCYEHHLDVHYPSRHTHGTLYHYDTIGCRCDECKDAKRKRMRQNYLSQNPGAPTRRTNAAHGTLTMYNNYDCRCSLCKEAKRRYRSGLPPLKGDEQIE